MQKEKPKAELCKIPINCRDGLPPNSLPEEKLPHYEHESI